MDTDRRISIKNIRRDKLLVVMILPVIVYFILFAYLPMYGLVIAFKDYSPGRGIWGSPWAGLINFKQFFGGFFFKRLFRNTLLISIYGIIFGFPVPIIFALILNEFKDGAFKRTIQTMSYLPHFISLVVICGMIVNFLSPQNGIVNVVLEKLIGRKINFLTEAKWFRTIYISSGIWQEFGWNSIIYIAALSGIDPNLYEAAKIDGAGRLQQIWHVSLPGIKATIVTLLILSVGNMMSVGFEKIILLYKPSTYETADVISTYVYRVGLAIDTKTSPQYSFSAAVGFFNSFVNMILLLSCNWISKKITDHGIW